MRADPEGMSRDRASRSTRSGRQSIPRFNPGSAGHDIQRGKSVRFERAGQGIGQQIAASNQDPRRNSRSLWPSLHRGGHDLCPPSPATRIATIGDRHRRSTAHQDGSVDLCSLWTTPIWSIDHHADPRWPMISTGSSEGQSACDEGRRRRRVGVRESCVGRRSRAPCSGKYVEVENHVLAAVC